MFTATSTGKVSHTYTVDEKVDLDMLAFALDIDTDTAFNFGFDLTVATNSSAGSATFNMTPSAKDDWQASATFTDLDANTVYTVFARAPEHDTKIAGAVSAPLYVVTDVLGTVQGDVNGNGRIDTTDAVWVLEQALDFAVMKNETMIGLCDVNGDGKINTLDSRFVLKQIVNDPSTTY